MSKRDPQNCYSEELIRDAWRRNTDYKILKCQINDQSENLYKFEPEVRVSVQAKAEIKIIKIIGFSKEHVKRSQKMN